MICEILLKGGISFYCDGDDPSQVLSRIKADIPITVWWWSANGTRYEEEMAWMNPEDDIIFVRTDNDART